MSDRMNTTQGTHQHESFSFPMLKNQEILACLSEININLDDNAEQKLLTAGGARPETLRRVYEVLVCECLDLTMEELYQPKFEGLDALKNPSLHDDSVATLHFIRSMNKLLTACGVKEGFHIRDLIKPDPKRTRRNLSAIINFHKFREERLAVYAQFSEKGEELMGRRRQLEDEKGELEEELQKLKDERASEQPEVDSLQNECSDLEKRIGELNRTQAKLKSQTEELKREANEIKTQTQAEAYEVEQKQEELETCSKQIVDDPSSEKQQVWEVERAVKNARQEVHDSQKALDDIKSRNQLATTALSQMEEVIEMAKSAKEKQDELNSQQTELNKIKSEYQDIETEIEQTSEMLRTVRKQHDKWESKLRNLRESMEVKERAAEKAASSGRRELNELNNAAQQAFEKRQEAEERIKEIEDSVKNARERYDEVMQEFSTAWRKIQYEVETFHRRLFKGIENVKEFQQQQKNSFVKDENYQHNQSGYAL
eukprot:gb/GECG01015185.1/.p1 GENE.gb/GECG01015185.1/~~gb/GECG01015185.1/.p1  ORF type:complete len:485 (+),score=97.67 gb/GECG01015185.1/:1-1455(+)